MTTHSLFPTLITERSNDNHATFKKVFVNNVHKHMTEDGRSDESTGHVDIHTDPGFKEFFTFIADSVREYVSTLNIDPDTFEYNLVKSWLNTTTESDNPIHDHADAHVSFSYYVNIPEGLEKFLVFYRPHDTNSLYNGMLNFNINEHNAFNASTWKLRPEEGKVFVFPSSLKHSVLAPHHDEPVFVPEMGTVDVMSRRICIAGDFLLTHKHKTTQFLGLQPVKNWRTF
jgi:hypothetical protein